MNRCLALALLVLVVSSSMNELQEALEYAYDETYRGIMYLGGMQEGSATQGPWWNSVLGWWGSEEVGVIRRRKRPISGRGMLRPKPKV